MDSMARAFHVNSSSYFSKIVVKREREREDRTRVQAPQKKNQKSQIPRFVMVVSLFQTAAVSLLHVVICCLFLGGVNKFGFGSKK